MFTSIRQRLLVTLGLIAIAPLVFISMYSYRYFNNVWVNMNTINLAYLNNQTTNQLNDLFLKSIDQVFSWRERKDWAEVKEGEASIFRPANGNYALVARVQMDDWPRIAAAK